jgi:hypothetical protein
MSGCDSQSLNPRNRHLPAFSGNKRTTHRYKSLYQQMVGFVEPTKGIEPSTGGCI